MRLRRAALTALVILALFFIWGNSALSREVSQRLSDAVKAFLSNFINLPGGDGVKSTLVVRKSAHFTEFFALGALVFARLRSGSAPGRAAGTALWALLFCAGAACMDETVQILSGRASMLRDAALDTAGAAAGIGAVWLAFALVKLIKRKIKC